MEVSSQDTQSYDFGFAFNQVKFSDSVLRVEIIPDPSGSGTETDDSLADRMRNRKRRRDDQITNNDETTERYEENIPNRSVLDLEDGVDNEIQEQGAKTMAEESPEDLENSPDLIGHGTAQEPETSSGMEVKTIHISAPILAAKSLFFYKLFSNAPRFSKQRLVTLRIHASEEDAFMDLLNYIYRNSLRCSTPTELLNVLVAADKFEVASCMRYCSQLLQNLPMSDELAVVYLDLPSRIQMVDAVRPLMEAARKSLVTRFTNTFKGVEEVLNLPISSFEAFLSSDDLRVFSEDLIYKLVLKWVGKHYPKAEDRREILSTRLVRYIRFPYMSWRQLRNVLACEDIERGFASRVVREALLYKTERPFESSNPPQHRMVERNYLCRPTKVVSLESPRQQRICYLDLKREECVRLLFPSGTTLSEPFDVGGRGLVLCGFCRADQQQNGDVRHRFGLFLWMVGEGSASLTIEYEFASRAKPSGEFVSKFRATSTFASGTREGCRNLFGIPWTEFIADDSPYFIDGVMHLRAEITVKEQ